MGYILIALEFYQTPIPLSLVAAIILVIQIVLAISKVNLNVNKTYYLEFTLRLGKLDFKFVEVGLTDTVSIEATDNTLSGNKVNLSCYPVVYYRLTIMHQIYRFT